MTMSVLNLGYDNLPTNLKACFTFCSIFPQSWEFNKRDLISLWMAQGFIEPPWQHNRGLQDVREEYFDELVKRSLFYNVKRDALGNISTCQMHDLVHDLALMKATQQNLSTSSWITPTPKMRTLIQLVDKQGPHGAYAKEKLAELTCKNLYSVSKCLRALDLHDCGFNELPSFVSKLLWLRYLDLSNNGCLVELPESITRLYHLQTLKLSFCENLKRLPKGIGRLVNLTRLKIDQCDNLTAFPLGFERLTRLETLTQFIVGNDGLDPERNCGLRALNGLKNLKGRLTIELSGERTNVLAEAAAANLSGKSKLSELRISRGLKRLTEVDPLRYQALLEGIKPLVNLTVLDIDGCKECEHLPELDRLPFLKRLTLRHMDGVKYVERITQPCPTIFFLFFEELTLQSFYNLEGWWNQEIGEVEVEEQTFPFFPCLVKLKIWNCPKLIVMPLFPHLDS